MKVAFRRADARDVPHLVDLRKQMQKGDAPEGYDRDLWDYYASAIAEGSLAAFLAMDGEQAVAMSGICFYRLPPHHSNPSGWIAYVASVYTVPDYRRQGLATRLLGLALEEAKRRGCGVARLHASAEGRGIYERKGFAAAEGYMSIRL